MTNKVLNPCRLCAGEAKFLHGYQYQVAYYFEEGEFVEHNFLHYGAIICSNCSLNLPIFGEDHKEIDDAVASWNGTYNKEGKK